MTEKTKKCFYCRKEFSTSDKHENFCSKKCFGEYEKKTEEMLEDKNTCEFC
ncbi:hypothetical protein KKG83_02310 [Candidatus Micrarchaeota archaeon]|nr:hypothetical protein [Candidatus Micrarchaeota archaeon]MBU2476284.1 hypothetical protein [Candidatus Micrarchaeota archaeon]